MANDVSFQQRSKHTWCSSVIDSDGTCVPSCLAAVLLGSGAFKISKVKIADKYQGG